MPGVATFNDFMASTGPTYLTSAEAVINDAARQNYVFSALLRGKDMSRVIQSGQQIRDVIMLDESSTYTHYRPNESLTWRNPQVTDTILADWRFSVDHMAWTDQEILLNVPDGLNPNAAKAVYKRLKSIKEQRLWTSFCNGYEDDLWAQPSQTEMEGQTNAVLPYSLPCFITERSLATSIGIRGSLAFQANGTGMTSVMGLTPATDPRWSNAVEFYNPRLNLTQEAAAQASATPVNFAVASDGVHAAADTSPRAVYPILQAFLRLWNKLKFIAPLGKEEYFTNSTIAGQMILCSLEGQRIYQTALRAANDSLMGAGSPSDPAYHSPLYAGIPLRYVSALDTAALYPRAASTVNNSSARAAQTVTGLGPEELMASASGTTIDKGPRFFFVNSAFLTPIIHSQRYMEKHEPMRHPNQPFSWVQPVDSWWNLFCNSRNRHGIIAPLCV
jgi:hypothetical protein